MRRGGERILIDCGEGTQRQLMRSVGLPDLDDVFITHLHADHWLGLPGMLQDLRPARPRAAARTSTGRPGLRELIEVLRAVYGELGLPVERRRARARARRSSATATRSQPFYVAPPRAGVRLRAHRGRPSWPLRRRARRGLGVAPGPDFGRLQRGETVAASARAGDRRGARRAARSSSPATRRPARRRDRGPPGRPARPRGDVHRRRDASARARDRALDRARRRREVARRGGRRSCSR